MPTWFKKVFSSGVSKPPAPTFTPTPREAPAPPSESAQDTAGPAPAPYDTDEALPKIRNLINAPVIVPEEEQSSWSEEVRIKARVEPDGMSCLFMVDRPVLEGLSAWFPDAAWAKDVSALAERLFEIDGVGTVLLHDLTVTIGHAEDSTRGWEYLGADVGTAIREHLKAGKPIVFDTFREGMPPEEEIRQKLQSCLDLEINPGIAAHSGVVTIDRVVGNAAYITMGGGCQGCAASTLTLRYGIHNIFRRAVPELGAIYDETDHASGTNPYFKELPAGMA